MAFDDSGAFGVRQSDERAAPMRGRRIQRLARGPIWIALVACLGLGAVEGVAQSREVLIGTTRIGAPAESDSDRATTMLDQAIRAVERGDVMLGKQALEALIARFPDTLAASAARGTLQDLARSDRRAQPNAGPDPSTRWNLVQSEGSSRAASGYGAGPDGRANPAIQSREETSALAAERLRRVQEERRQQVMSERFQNTAGDRVFFSELGVELGARARAVLAAQARWLVENADAVATIESHADDSGQREQDFLIAERRAMAVKARLIEEGVPSARLQVRVHGRDQPIAVCSLPECKAQNRRVITRIGTGADLEPRRNMPAGGSLALTPNQIPAPNGRGR